jgi:hypothetical protein
LTNCGASRASSKAMAGACVKAPTQARPQPRHRLLLTRTQATPLAPAAGEPARRHTSARRRASFVGRPLRRTSCLRRTAVLVGAAAACHQRRAWLCAACRARGESRAADSSPCARRIARQLRHERFLAAAYRSAHRGSARRSSLRPLHALCQVRTRQAAGSPFSVF